MDCEQQAYVLYFYLLSYLLCRTDEKTLLQSVSLVGGVFLWTVISLQQSLNLCTKMEITVIIEDMVFSCFVCVDSLCHSRQSFSQVGMISCLPGLKPILGSG